MSRGSYDRQATGHSSLIGFAQDGQFIYGQYEASPNVEPLLDACSGHFGRTPDSSGQVVYHYHVQPRPPFTVGCFGESV